MGGKPAALDGMAFLLENGWSNLRVANLKEREKNNVDASTSL